VNEIFTDRLKNLFGIDRGLLLVSHLFGFQIPLALTFTLRKRLLRLL